MLRRPDVPKIARIDMTPMIGTLLVVLFIFMAAQPVCACKGVDLELPTVSDQWPDDDIEEGSVYLALTAKEETYFNGRRLEGGLEELRGRLVEEFSERPRAPRFARLKGDVSAPFGTVSAVLRTSREAGVRSMRLIAVKHFDETF